MKITTLFVIGLVVMILQPNCASAGFFERLLQTISSVEIPEVCLNPPTYNSTQDANTYNGSLVADFPERLQFLNEWIKTKKEPWKWAPPVFPPVEPPSFVSNPVQWKRDRVIAVAKSLVGFPYRHNYVPFIINPQTGCGLDCSNLSGWVYNFGLGIYFRRDIDGQAQGTNDNSRGGAPGRVLQPGEKLEPADLIYYLDKLTGKYRHVAIILDSNTILHAANEQKGILIDKFRGKFDLARRIIE